MKKNSPFRAITGLLLMLTLACGKEAKKEAPVYSEENPYTTEEQASSALMGLFEAVKTDDLQSFRNIFSTAPSVDLNALIGTHKDTLLITALKNRSRSIFDFLMDRGSDKGVEKSVDLELMSEDSSSFGLSPLSIATVYNRFNMAKILLQKGARINRVDRNGYTALHYALLNKNDRMAILLIQNKADINITDPQGRNAYKMALELECVGTIDYIHGLTQINQGAIPESETLKKLIEVGDVPMVYRVLARHPDLISKYEVINPLALALEILDDNRAFQMVSVLISAGFHADGLKKDIESPLIRAVKKNRILIAEILLQNGSDVNLLDAEGFSPLYHAIKGNFPELVDLLVSRGAKKFYKHKTEDGKYYFWVCTEARKVKKELSDSKSFTDNNAILQRLNCL